MAEDTVTPFEFYDSTKGSICGELRRLTDRFDQGKLTGIVLLAFGEKVGTGEPEIMQLVGRAGVPHALVTEGVAMLMDDLSKESW